MYLQQGLLTTSNKTVSFFATKVVEGLDEKLSLYLSASYIIMSFLKKCPEGLILKVTVQPGASKNMVVGPYNNTLKIKLTARPVDGAANKMCIKFLSRCLDVSKSSLEIISGSTHRAKTFLLRCNTLADVLIEQKRLEARIQSILQTG